MKISTRGRYALRVMIDLAEHRAGEYIPLMDIAKRQEISEKYLESIVSILNKSGFLVSLRGKSGGYRLAREAESYTVASVLHLTEGSLAPIPCVEQEENDCPRASFCKTVAMWKGLHKVIEDYLNSITIADLAEDQTEFGDYVI